VSLFGLHGGPKVDFRGVFGPKHHKIGPIYAELLLTIGLHWLIHHREATPMRLDRDRFLRSGLGSTWARPFQTPLFHTARLIKLDEYPVHYSSEPVLRGWSYTGASFLVLPLLICRLTIKALKPMPVSRQAHTLLTHCTLLSTFCHSTCRAEFVLI